MKNYTQGEIKYDYSLALLVNERSETLLGGTRKILNKALKSDDFNVKGLTVFYRENELGFFMRDICQCFYEGAFEAVKACADRLYSNLASSNANNLKIADTKLSLETMYLTSASVTVRVLAKTLLEWYGTVTEIYMGGKIGLPLSRAERADLGKRFREDFNELLSEFGAKRENKKAIDAFESDFRIVYPTADISEFLDEYNELLCSRRVYSLLCKSCSNYFISASWNARYCSDCKEIQRHNSKKSYSLKCSGGVHQKRQQIKYRFENFVHKNKIFNKLSEEQQDEYQNLRKEFVETSAKLLQEFDNGRLDLENEIENFLRDSDNRRAELEQKLITGLSEK